MRLYSEFSTAAISDAVRKNPSFFAPLNDDRLGRGVYGIRLAPDIFIVCDGAMSKAGWDLCSLYHAIGGVLATAEGANVTFSHRALKYAGEIQELIHPYKLVVQDDIWLIDGPSGLRNFTSHTYYHNCPEWNKKQREEAQVWRDCISDYVDAIDIATVPEYTMCPDCINHTTHHILSHISRGEASLPLLVGLGVTGNQSFDSQRTALKDVLLKVLVEPNLNNGVTFRLSPEGSAALETCKFSSRHGKKQASLDTFTIGGLTIDDLSMSPGTIHSPPPLTWAASPQQSQPGVL